MTLNFACSQEHSFRHHYVHYVCCFFMIVIIPVVIIHFFILGFDHDHDWYHYNLGLIIGMMGVTDKYSHIVVFLRVYSAYC